ncbi:MAG: hypothetical protein AB4426_28150 [Xenococcaceae cyanobacterium]
MRIYLYILAGVTSALIGWNIGQFFLADLKILTDLEEVVLFPCVAISLAIAMVLNEIFISNPTRLSLSFRKARIPLLIALGLGLALGLVAGGISQILIAPDLPVSDILVRMLGWLLIGIAVGLAEGLSWWWQSVEARDPKRFWQRMLTSVISASVASLIAAGLFELIRNSQEEAMSVALKKAEDPLGFSLLGLLLGLTFSLTNSPSFRAALRAGAGFEFTGPVYAAIGSNPNQTTQIPDYSSIDQSLLTFIGEDDDQIEEGLSIQLPARGTIVIGSPENPEAHIRMPGVPKYLAQLDLNPRQTKLIPQKKNFANIAINGERLNYWRKVTLKHNYVLTFYALPQGDYHEEKIYRFVYYNRFLDPQS